MPAGVIGERQCPKMDVGIYIYSHVADTGAFPQAARAGLGLARATPRPPYLRSGDLQGGVQVRLLEQEARGFLHLGGPDAGVQGCFGDGDVCRVSSFSLRNGF